MILKKVWYAPDNTVIRAKAPIAPANTVILGCRMAMMAAMKNVLSPNSETMMTDKDATKAWINPTSLSAGSGVGLSSVKKLPCCEWDWNWSKCRPDIKFHVEESYHRRNIRFNWFHVNGFLFSNDELAAKEQACQQHIHINFCKHFWSFWFKTWTNFVSFLWHLTRGVCYK